MKKRIMKKRIGAALIGIVTLAASQAMAAPDYSDLETAISEGALAVAGTAGVAIAAGFGIFVLIWGARKVKSALSSGS